MTYAPVKFEVATSNGLGGYHLQEKHHLTLTTQNVAQYPLHHVICTAAKFEATISKGLGGDAFTENTVFDPDHGVKVIQNVSKYHLHNLTYAACYVELFRRRYINKKSNGQTHRQTDDGSTLVRNQYTIFSKE